MGEVQTTGGTAILSEREKIALLGLWSVPGLGIEQLADIRAWAGGELANLLDVPVAEFANGSAIPSLLVSVRQLLCDLPSLEAAAESVMRRAKASRMRVHFKGEPGYPELLARTYEAPPVIFAWGQLGPSRRRVAMVGSRYPETRFKNLARQLAHDVASHGVGVVSGLAVGVDSESHEGALFAQGETWAFVGSALDELDAHQRGWMPKILKAGGVLMTEYPPGVRADKRTFPRRNRLIAGASDATVVVRARAGSGAIYTATRARAYSRPVLALPGDVRDRLAAGCNWLIKKGFARAFLGADDILAAVGLARSAPVGRVAPNAEVMESLSADARAVYEALPRAPTDLEVLADSVDLSAASLTAALVELELQGLVQQYPGKVFEKL